MQVVYIVIRCILLSWKEIGLQNVNMMIVFQTKNLGQDELEVVKATMNHPNFVKTFVVIVKKDVGEHRIVMEKCGIKSGVYQH